MKKLLAALLCLVLCLAGSALADDKRSEEYEYALLEDGTAKITKYTGQTEALIIPAELDGHTVTAIGVKAFERESSLTSVMIPDGVTLIDDFAFSYCSGMSEVTIPGSVSVIGEGAFSDCSSLESVAIPDSVTSINMFAFYGCSGLMDVTIPDSVVKIGVNAFAECPNLKLTVSRGSYAAQYCEEHGLNYTYSNS